jgi:hypothetical protein
MKQMIFKILAEKNLEPKNLEPLYEAGMRNIVSQIEFYFDKPYTCESVFKELFRRGVMEELKNQSHQ